MAGRDDDRYDEDEARARFEAALRGSRIVGHKPMSELKVKSSAKRKRAKRKSETAQGQR